MEDNIEFSNKLVILFILIIFLNFSEYNFDYNKIIRNLR